MFKPTPKSPSIERMLSALTNGKNRIVAIKSGKCMTCDNPDMDFRDALSVREYTISGMCQRCQDEVFQ